MEDPRGSGPVAPGGGASYPPRIDLPPGVPVKTGMRTGARVAIGCGIGCLVLLVVGAVALGAFFYWAGKPPEDVEIEVTVPLRAVAGEEVELVVSVTNLGYETQLLDSVDIFDSYMQGVAIHGTDPPYTDYFHLPVVNVRTYEFQRSIPSGETVEVVFRAVAVKEGDFAGQFDVCINLPTSCLSRPVRTVIREE